MLGRRTRHVSRLNDAAVRQDHRAHQFDHPWRAVAGASARTTTAARAPITTALAVSASSTIAAFTGYAALHASTAIGAWLARATRATSLAGRAGATGALSRGRADVE